MSKLAKALTAAAGNAGESLYVEDVFSTYLWTGDGTTDRPIQNGIDLDGEGGLVWIKEREQAGQHMLTDTEKGLNSVLRTNSTAAQLVSPVLTSFDSDGFSLTNNTNVNQSGQPTCSWTFRKAEKFFDVVTWTGDGTGVRTISHSLNGTVGALFMKATNASMQWFSYHNGLTNAQFLELNATTTAVSSANAWNNTTPTSSEFTVGSYGNISGRTYVAYLFASDAGGFGDDGSESIIKCGSYTGNSSTDGPEINLGFEPQFLLVKAVDKAEYWVMVDTMRGVTGSTTDPWFAPNVSEAEFDDKYFEVKATGFKPVTIDARLNGSGYNYIYIAIRRPMKTPESGTEVFAIDTAVDYTTNPSGKSFDSGFPVDMFLNKEVDQSYNNALYSRLTNKGLRTNTTDSEFNMGGTNWDSNIAVYQTGSTNTNNYAWMFKRATGFFDVVAYTGDGVAGSTQAHNLGVAPELMIVKSRSNTDNWAVYDSFNTATHFMNLELSDQSYNNSSRWNGVEPTSEVFTVGTHDTNLSGYTYIAYLFASVAGVSKVGSYTGTGSNVDVDCGFSAGARFILIKRTDSTGDWYVWDSERGIVAGNDPYLLLNSTAAEVTSTDYIDPLNAGFTVTSSAPAALNASGGSYIFLAIA
jgi:hypothetical protein